MKQALQHIISLLLVVIVLFTTSGYYLFRHDCHHMKSMKASIILEKNCCNEYSLGNMFAGLHPNTTTCEAEGCCKTTKTFYKLESAFEQVHPIKFQKNSFDKKIIYLNYSVIDPVIHHLFKRDYAANGPPIRLKQSIYFTQNLKLGPPLIC